MPKKTDPVCSHCGEGGLKGSKELKDKLHDKCRRKADQQRKDEQVKAKMAKDLEDRQEKMKADAAKQVKNRDTGEEKSKAIAAVAADWNKQIVKVVKQVEKLRKDNDGDLGINAGENGTLGKIPGGTNNPIEFELPKQNPLGITKAEVSNSISGFDGSDSGTFKFKRGKKIFVHGR